MSLKLTIQQGVNSAFNALNDLVEIARFEEELVEGYDFVNKKLDSTVEPLLVEMIPTEHVTENGSVIRTKFIARSTDFDISKYSVFTLKGDSYRIESFSTYEGVHLLDAVRIADV